MNSYKNPYNNGNVIWEVELFYNREYLVKELIQPDPRAYYIRGNRRIGKTSLLQQINRQLLNSENALPIYVDLEGVESIMDLAEYFQWAINKTLDAIGLPAVVFKENEKIFDTITAWLKYNQQINRHSFLILDEAEELLGLSNNDLARLHRILVKGSKNLTVIITATNRLQEFFHRHDGKTNFLENFITKPIGGLSSEDAEKLIRQSQHPNSRVEVDETTVKNIIRYAGTHPFLIQRLCFNLFENGTLRKVQEKDLVLDKELRDIIRIDFNHLDPDHQQVLLHFSWEQGLSTNTINGFTKTKTDSILLELEQLGFLRSEGQQYYLGNYFLAQWLEEQQPPVPLIKNGLPEAHEGETGYNIDKQTTKETITHTMQKLNVFISYSHKDEAFKEALDAHLTILRRSDKINTWNDRAILAGTQWDDEIKQQLEDAHIILLLISANFLSSDYIWKEELARAMERHDRGEAKVIPIFIKPCEWKGASFGKVQGLPKDAKPVGSADNDEAWTGVAAGIRTLVDKLLEKGLEATNSPIPSPAIKLDASGRLPPPANIAAIEKAVNEADYATAIELMDEYFGYEPTSQYSTLKQTIEHHLNQGMIPPPATLQGLRLLINKLKK